VIPKKIGGPVISREEQVDVAVAVKVGDGQAATDFGLAEVGPNFLCHVAKLSVAQITKELRWLGVSDVAANVPDRFVDVPVGKRQIQITVEVEIGEDTAEAQHRFSGSPDTR